MPQSKKTEFRNPLRPSRFELTEEDIKNSPYLRKISRENGVKPWSDQERLKLDKMIQGHDMEGLIGFTSRRK